MVARRFPGTEQRLSARQAPPALQQTSQLATALDPNSRPSSESRALSLLCTKEIEVWCTCTQGSPFASLFLRGSLPGTQRKKRILHLATSHPTSPWSQYFQTTATKKSKEMAIFLLSGQRGIENLKTFLHINCVTVSQK